ncbi:hypothetical protein HY061_02945 [Candidatus Azambacteria bacterium]|nr:hypothetical protein [Candidatus Azambacteria bacterium]
MSQGEEVSVPVSVFDPRTGKYRKVSLRIISSKEGNPQVKLYDPCDGEIKVSWAAIQAGAVVIIVPEEKGGEI